MHHTQNDEQKKSIMQTWDIRWSTKDDEQMCQTHKTRNNEDLHPSTHYALKQERHAQVVE